MRAHLFRPLQDTAGNLQRGATVRVYQPGTSVLFDGALYVDDDEESGDTYSQPVACPNGVISIYFGAPTRVRLGVTPFGGGTEVFFEDIDASAPQVRAQDVSIRLSSINSFDVRSAIAEIVGYKYGPDNPPPTGASGAAKGTSYIGYGILEEFSNVQDALDGLVERKYGPDVPEPFRVVTASETLAERDAIVFANGTDLTLTLPVLVEPPPPPPPPPPADSDGDGIPDFEDPDYVPPPPVDPNDQDGDGIENSADPDYVPPPPPEPETPPVHTPTTLGRKYVIKNLHSSVLTVTRSETALIDGDTTRSLSQYDVLTVVWDGTNWGVI